MIRGVKEHLFCGAARHRLHAQRDRRAASTSTIPASITNADLLHPAQRRARSTTRAAPDLVVCWGGHSIPRDEYDYTKQVGYELGLRGLDVCTGCGPGAMKGPMKGATIGHAKQRIKRRPLHRHHRAGHHRRRAAEPDRQPAGDHAGHREAPRSVRAPRPRHHRVPGRRRHGRGDPLPARHPARPGEREPAAAARLHRPASSAGYFAPARPLHRADARRRGAAALPDHRRTTRRRSRANDSAASTRCALAPARTSDAYNYNWLLRIPREFQQPFEPSHEAMAALDLHRRTSRAHQLAANLRRAFSGIVAGNVKERRPPPDRGAGPVRDPRGARDHAGRSTSSCAAFVGPAAHEAGRGIPPELPHRLIAQEAGLPARDLVMQFLFAPPSCA